MTLRKKTLIIIGLVLIGLVLLLYAVSQGIMLNSFTELEKHDTSRNVERALNVLSDDVAQLESTVADWAPWDDTYAFVDDLNDSYIENNLNEATIANLRVDLVLFINSSGQVVYGESFDLQDEQEKPIPQSLEGHLYADSPLVYHSDTESSVSGIVLLPEGPLLIASHPILTSGHEGPMRGALIMGRYLDSAEIAGLAETMRLSLTLHSLDEPQMPTDFEAARSMLSEAEPIFVQPLDSDSVGGYTFVKDIYGEPVLILRAEMPREIYQQGQTSQLYFILLLLAVGLVFVVAVLLLLEKLIISPLSRLNSSVSSIGANGDLSARVSVTGRDELANLSGEINRMLGVMERSQKALRESELIATATIEGMSDGVMLVNMEGKIVYVNKAFERLLGHKADEVIGTSALELPTYRGSKERDKAREILIEVIKKGGARPLDMIAIAKNGEEVPISFMASVIRDAEGNPKTLVAVLRDVTERRWAEEALRHSEEHFRALVENSMDAIVIIGREGAIKYSSPSVERSLGYKIEELAGSDGFGFAHPDDMPGVANAFSEVMQEPGASTHVELRIKHKDGSWRIVEAIARNLLDDPMVEGIVVNWRDVTERRKASEALKLSEERYRLVVENANEAILVAQDGMLKFFNHKVTEVLGYSGEDLASKPFIELIHPEDQTMVAGRYMARLEGKEVPPVYPFRVVDKEGKTIWVEISAIMFTWEGRPATLNFLTDLTERKKAEEEKKRMEEQIQVAGRLAAVGELSAGVAHELNNPLAAIQGYAQFLSSRNDLDEKMKKDVGIIYREAQRASRITKNLLAFARKHEPEKKLISLNEAIEKTLELRNHQMKLNNIELVEELDHQLPKTMADFYQMQQVFMNIIVNAEQAMAEANGKGRLVVRTRNVDGMNEITFTDDGPGITEENLKRIFDPFFTTKEVGKGTGLGLSICYGLVQAHGGRLYARSKSGEGATFVVEIPVVTDGQKGREV